MSHKSYIFTIFFILLAHPAIEAKPHSAKPDQTQTSTSKKEEAPKNCIRRPKPKQDTWLRKTGKWIENQFADQGSSKREDKPANSKELAK